MEPFKMEAPKHEDLGAWVGRQQAFAVIAGSCSAARAQCLKQVRDSQMLDHLGLTWEEFCKDYAGISRQHADSLIRQHEAFGDAYFRLSEIARISPRTYQKIASHIDGDTIEIGGQKLSLTPENAHKIRAAINSLRSQSKPSRRPAPATIEMQVRLDALAGDFSKSVQALDSAENQDQDRSDLRTLATHAMNQFRRLARQLEPATTANQ